jgi:hypothetical protein
VLDPELPTRLLLRLDEKPQFPRLPLGVSANKHQGRTIVEEAQGGLGKVRLIGSKSKASNGDGKADFEIFVKVGSLAKGDFLL